MSELIEFIGEKSFEEVKNLCSSLNIDVKETEKMYILNFSNDADFNNELVRQANGVIFEKDTNKLLHFSFEKSYDGIRGFREGKDFFKEDLGLGFDLDDYTIELYFEGSIIKLYYYDDEWNISTSKHIESNKNKWTSSKTFDILFKEAVVNSYNCKYSEFVDTFEKDCCYTFLLQHPDNNMSINVSTPVVFQINKVNLKTLEEERPEQDNLKVSKTIKEVFEDKNQNFMIYKKNKNNNRYTRIKLLSNSYSRMIELRGVYPDISLSYMCHLNDINIINEYRLLYPQYIKKFNLIDKLLYKTTRLIHSLYIKIYAEKNEKEEIPEQYKRTLIQLHGLYKKKRTPISFEDVLNKIINFQPKLISFIIGYKYNNSVI